jgi:hypothetical protein
MIGSSLAYPLTEIHSVLRVFDASVIAKLGTCLVTFLRNVLSGICASV